MKCPSVCDAVILNVRCRVPGWYECLRMLRLRCGPDSRTLVRESDGLALLRIMAHMSDRRLISHDGTVGVLSDLSARLMSGEVKMMTLMFGNEMRFCRKSIEFIDVLSAEVMPAS